MVEETKEGRGTGAGWEKRTRILSRREWRAGGAGRGETLVLAGGGRERPKVAQALARPAVDRPQGTTFATGCQGLGPPASIIRLPEPAPRVPTQSPLTNRLCRSLTPAPDPRPTAIAQRPIRPGHTPHASPLSPLPIVPPVPAPPPPPAPSPFSSSSSFHALSPAKHLVATPFLGLPAHGHTASASKTFHRSPRSLYQTHDHRLDGPRSPYANHPFCGPLHLNFRAALRRRSPPPTAKRSSFSWSIIF